MRRQRASTPTVIEEDNPPTILLQISKYTLKADALGRVTKNTYDDIQLIPDRSKRFFFNLSELRVLLQETGGEVREDIAMIQNTHDHQNQLAFQRCGICNYIQVLFLTNDFFFFCNFCCC